MHVRFLVPPGIFSTLPRRRIVFLACRGRDRGLVPLPRCLGGRSLSCHASGGPLSTGVVTLRALRENSRRGGGHPRRKFCAAPVLVPCSRALRASGKFPKSAGAPAPDPILARGGATLASLQNLCRTRRPRDIPLPPASPPPEFPAKPQSHRLGGATCDSAARAAMQYPEPRCCGNWFCSAGVPGKKRCHGKAVRNRAQQPVAAMRGHHAIAEAMGLCEEISRGRHPQRAQGRTDAAVG